MAVKTWADMAPEQRSAAIRAAYLAGLSNAQIAARLRTSKDAVLGWAWRRGLNRSNAETWTERPKLRQASTAFEYNRNRVRKPRPPRPRKSIAERRAKLVNRGTNTLTREGVAIINAIPAFDHTIADTLGVASETVRKWRRGAHSISPFMLQCIRDAAARLR
jgi:DNA-binding transcriptional regulator YiaG